MRWALGLVASMIVAGCTANLGEPLGDSGTSFDDLGVQATATTGVIRGIVVDERIVPVKGAEVDVTGINLDRAAVSDTEGRFAFVDLQPGTYFLRISSLLHDHQQTSVEVIAGISDPPIVKIQLTRRFSEEPYVEALKHEGFIQCNQAGLVYATAPCVTDFTGLVPSYTGIVPPGCTPGGCAPQLRTVQTENRGFHAAVGPGWQTLIWEMDWDETSDTFSRMGVTVSYNVTQRPASHNYLSYGSEAPLRVQLDLGVDHENSNDVEPDLLWPEGRPDLYYFVGVRSSGGVPAVAVNQAFQLYVHFFYYGIAPEGWSFINGDSNPF